MIIDAVVALAFVIAVLASLWGIEHRGESLSEITMKRIHYASQDTLDVMNKKGVLGQIGIYWADAAGNESSQAFQNATLLAQENLDVLLPPNFGYILKIDGQHIVNRTNVPFESATSVSQSSRLLVGYGAGLPTLGGLARAYLTSVRAMETSSYAYFGGYVGQGNITVYIMDIPPDAIISRACLELNTPSEFELSINGANAGIFTPTGDSMSANIREGDPPGSGNGCMGSSDIGNIIPGSQNEFRINFINSDLNESYIGGGYIHLRYNTTYLQTDAGKNTYRHYLPGIEGLINLYDSFYVPGLVQNMEANLHFKSNYSTYMTIGNVQVMDTEGSESDRFIYISNSDMVSSGLIYGPLGESGTMSMNTVPIRVGTGNITSLVQAGNADVVLITDLSGSMLRCLDSNSPCTIDSECSGSRCRWPYSKELNKMFTELILNNTGNRVGLVTYSWDGHRRHDLSSDGGSLNASIDGFPLPAGGTCVCCAIRQARAMLDEQSTLGREKYIIVMTDGITNLRCEPADVDRASCCTDQSGFALQCTSPFCGGGLYHDSLCDDYLDDTAVDNAIDDSQSANQLLNATLHTIGFGAGAINCQYALDALDDISAAGGGKSCASDDENDLMNCYMDFASQIYTSSVHSQTIYFGGELMDSILYPDSYIDMEFLPDDSHAGQIELKAQTDPFDDDVNCIGHLYVPSHLFVSDARLTSYSGDHWTDLVRIDGGLGTRDAFRLSVWGSQYSILGDPYAVAIPKKLITSGYNNTFTYRTGDNESHSTGCSPDNRLIYTLGMDTLISYGSVFRVSDGCDWDIEFSDGSSISVSVPSAYSGAKQCTYTSSDISYDGDDSIDDAIFRLLSRMDFDSDGRVDILFDETMMEFEAIPVSEVRSLWGPAKFQLILWM